jgi:3',5'-cyclic AMP phosphodiesterase CpdA
MGSAHNSVRWLHLSDIHIGKDELVQKQMIDKLVQRITGGALLPDLIFFTGDLANRGQEKEYEQFLNLVLLPLKQALARLHGAEGAKRIFLIPGNHDVAQTESVWAWKGLRGELDEAQEIRVFDPNKEGLKQRQDFLKRFRAFALSRRQRCTRTR